ncbi:hypothetical protein [Flavobacterium sp. KACC 22763]|uniref:hypothetical protein n=1 Tax=Flavobacterium sp. KACC 22763 TaxID=3025668 RepID=UPI002364FF88|nr:hypothetical protein [Flavobacterium sp. KACC 22763]WDF65705.1 hypothetical protein PQ463_05930 [Flavobacterium sp. KACC 22763]
MAETIIENLKILSEKFKHNFDVFSNSVIFVNEVNKIRIEKEDDASCKVTYNLHFNEKTLLVSEEALYHFCLDLFNRQNDNIEVLLSVCKPIEINEWFKIEEAESLHIITSIQKELEYNCKLKYLFLESDRFETNYFNGLLIIEDKQKEYLSNIFNFRNSLARKVKSL